jgi:hypothetical protein
LGGEDEEESVTMGDMVERYNNGIWFSKQCLSL